MISVPGEIFVRLPSKSVNSGELPCGFGRTWLGKVSQGSESLRQRLREAQTQVLFSAKAASGSPDVLMEGPINYEKKSPLQNVASSHYSS